MARLAEAVFCAASAARSVSASRSIASSASATFWNATFTVPLYCAAATSSAACAARRRALSVPPWKIGCVRLLPMLQTKAGRREYVGQVGALAAQAAGQGDLRQH